MRRLELVRLLLLIAPLTTVFGAFFLVPLGVLFIIGAGGPHGLAAYGLIVTDARYFISMITTVLLSLAVTAVTLVISGITGVFLHRHRFFGRAVLISMMTLPLAFSGVVIAFMVIMLAGRQGAISDILGWITGQRWAFAYTIVGLFTGYIYFSIPRTILTILAAAEKIDPRLEEAARSLGARPWQVVRDIVIPALKPALIATGAICFATSMGAFGTPFALGTKIEVLPMTIYTTFVVQANIAVAAALSFVLGLATWLILAHGANGSRDQLLPLRDRTMRRRGPAFYAQFIFVMLVCAFLMVPVGMSMVVGVTRNYLYGVGSGLTLDWIARVWELYRVTIFTSIEIALLCLAATLILGIPAAYVLASRQSAMTRAIEELLVMPIAMPGLAIALALIVTYGGFGGFRKSILFILTGHILYTLPFMVRSVLAVLMSIDFKTLEESASKSGSEFSSEVLHRDRSELPFGDHRRLANGGDAFHRRIQHDPVAAYSLHHDDSRRFGRFVFINADRDWQRLYARVLLDDNSAAFGHSVCRPAEIETGVAEGGHLTVSTGVNIRLARCAKTFRKRRASPRAA